jgi:hypothetical protein
MLALLAGLALASCGGGGDPDATELKELRQEAKYTFDKADKEVVQFIESALAIAARNTGKPLGEEAFAFAQDLFLRHGWNDYYGDSYIDRVPEPSGIKDQREFQDLRRMVGFIETVPVPYEPANVLASLHHGFVYRVESYLRWLDEALESRQLWVNELQAAGSTKGSFNTEASGGWEEYGKQLAYLRTLAVRVDEPAGFLAGLDLVAAALAVADYEPPAATRTYEDGTFIATYTVETLQAGVANTEALAAAIAAARAAFPDAN